MRTPRLDPDALLCERCGYDLAGLTRDGRCPECGSGVEGSLPEHRTGSAWQRAAGLASYAASALDTIRRPRAMWDRVTVHPGGAAALEWISLLLAAAFGAVGIGLIAWWANVSRTPGINIWLVGPSVFVVLAVGLSMACFIERRGIRFYGARRRRRIHPGVARVVTAHAAPAWALWALVGAAGVVLGAALLSLPARNILAGNMLLLAPLAGLLHFETLVYIGSHRLRYANRAGAERSLAAPGEGGS